MKRIILYYLCILITILTIICIIVINRFTFLSTCQTNSHLFYKTQCIKYVFYNCISTNEDYICRKYLLSIYIEKQIEPS